MRHEIARTPTDGVTASSHDYGVFWLEQGRERQWTRRMIDSAWSQAHASLFVDLRGDGQPAFGTGKRFLIRGDPGERDPLGIYWYEYRKSDANTPGVQWIRHVVEYGGRIGAGVQLAAVDIEGDGDLDLNCPGKAGLFLLENMARPKNARTGE